MTTDDDLRALISDVVTAAWRHPAPAWLTDDLWQRLVAAARVTDPRGAVDVEQDALDLDAVTP